MSVNIGSFWKHKETGLGHVVQSVGTELGVFGQPFETVYTLGEDGAEYKHTTASLSKYHEQVDDV